MRLLTVALIATAGIIPAATAQAQVTNCSVGNAPTYSQGYCASTTANAPYTTQFRRKVYCATGGGGVSHTAIGAWRNAGGGVWSKAQCPTDYYRVGTGWFEYR